MKCEYFGEFFGFYGEDSQSREQSDENDKNIGTARQVGIDANQKMVLLITKNDGSEGTVSWGSIGKVGDVILLGNTSAPQVEQHGKCLDCGFVNNGDSKFCEECGTKLQ